MSIDTRAPSAWNEGDLRQLCLERRRENQRLEFKRELKLDSPGEKNDIEHDAEGMAAGGGGVVIYGVDEMSLADGTTVAGELRPMHDGTLYDRLEALLDSRGQPRLPFELHEIRAHGGGVYLVLEIFAGRRPHQASDGRYYGRRGTRVRQMEEAEIAEAYRERFLRDAEAIQPLLSPPRASDELPTHVRQRVHRGLKPSEMAVRGTSEPDGQPPGWMSVVVLPWPPRADMLDPINDRSRFEDSIQIPDRWDPDQWPLQYFDLLPEVAGLRAQLPPRDDVAPAYLVALYCDGVMEYGTTLEPALPRDDPSLNRIIFSLSHTHQAHDYLQAFAVALGILDYDGPVAAQISFDNLRGVRLGVAPDRDVNLHPLAVDTIRGTLWRGARRTLLEEAGRIVKRVMDDVFLAAGASNGAWIVDDEGNLRER